MGGWKVSPAKFRTCVCGRECKGLSALQTHGRKCPMEQARHRAFVDAIESGRMPPTDAQFRATYTPPKVEAR